MRVYLHLVEPEKYPAFSTRAAKAVTRGSLGNKIQFSSLRGFPTDDVKIKEIGEAADMGQRPVPKEGYRLKEISETIDMYVNHFNIGRVLWPVYPTLFAENFNELVDICGRESLCLYDFWGYVPGSRPVSGIWGEYKIPDEVDSYMKEKLGDRFLGYDNGEQDGRYIHAFARITAPVSENRRAQYRNFQAYFEKLNDAMRNNTVTLASLTFLHYFAKEGNTIMIGAETAQALPNNNMWFAFIRGASKQYGLLHYGNASVWNRWGYKDYLIDSDTPDTSNGYEMGRTGGTSLSQLRRLIYNHYMYNCDILGFEGSWFYSEKAEPDEKNTDKTYVINGKRYNITPVGEIQRRCAEFVEKHGSPGVLYTPLAIMADFFAGWVPPRHLYTGDIYRVWGNLPYGNGDYQLHLIFSMLFPGYENAGFYRDERGFLTPTPYGEIADVLLSDASEEVIGRYNVLLIVDGTDMTLELYLKIKRFVEGGGHAILFSDTVGSGSELSQYSSGFDYEFVFNIKLLKSSDKSVIIEYPFGKGKVTLIDSASALVRTKEEIRYENEVNSDIPNPYKLSPFLTEHLDGIFNAQKIVYADNRALQYTLDIKNADEYTLYVANNTLKAEAFDIKTTCGEITEVTELDITADGATSRPEFLPRGFFAITHADGVGKYVIAPYDCRIFNVKTKDIKLDELSESYPAPRSERLFLSVGYNDSENEKSAKEFILNNPTFSQRFSGLMLPAEYFDRTDEKAAEREAHYLNLQNISVIVDFTRMINHFPDLSIIGNFPNRTAETLARIESVIKKASYYKCRGAVFSLQRNAENEYTQLQAVSGALDSLRRINGICAAYKIDSYVQNRNILLSSNELFLKLGSDPSLGRAAYNTAFALSESGSAPDYKKAKASLVLISDTKKDMFGQGGFYCAPVASGDNREALKKLFCEAASDGDTLTVLCAQYRDMNGITDDLEFLYNTK